MAGEAAHTVKDERDDKPIFLHSELDDFGLDPFEFRVYSRLSRRADGPEQRARESIANMAEACKMGTTKVRQALRRLEELRLVSRVDRAGMPTEYRLAPKSRWKKPVGTPTPDVGATPHVGVTPTPRVEGATPHVGVPQRHTLPKVLHTRKSSKGDARAKRTRPSPQGEKAQDQGRPVKPIPKPKAKARHHEFDPATVELPDSFDRDQFERFMANQAKNGRRWTSEQLQEFLETYRDLPPPVIREMFRRANVGGWAQLYDLKADEAAKLVQSQARAEPPGTPDGDWRKILRMLVTGRHDARELSPPGREALSAIGGFLAIPSHPDDVDLREELRARFIAAWQADLVAA